jgi:AhpD family alkylhydroperoxidase
MARLAATTPRWSVRPLHWWQRFRYGRVLEPIQLWSRTPRVLRGFLRLFGALRRRGSPLTPELRSLVAVRVSQVIGCDFCIDMNGAFLLSAGAPQEKLLKVSAWRTEPMYSEAERNALEYAEAITCTPPTVTDDLFRRLQGSFSDEAIVELTALVAFQNMSARFNTALDAQAHGFCQIPQGALRVDER